MIKFTIPIKPTTKKNSQQIFYKKIQFVNSEKKIPFITPSKKFKQYQQECAFYMPNIAIKTTINIKATYYMPSKRKVDITNLNAALHDILVHYWVIEDDNCMIVASTDGSRVAYDKKNPRTEVEITASDYKCWGKSMDNLIPEKKKKLNKTRY